MYSPRQTISLDANWKFHLGEIASIRNRWSWAKSGSWNQGPESIEYDDSDWRQVNLPHDFVIETTPYEYSELEFTKDNTIPAMEDVGNIHTTAGSFKKEIGWYRKHFHIPSEYLGKKLYLIFEGIYRDSHAYLNEFYIGGERSGYSRIVYDITDVAEYGGDNLLSVKCNAKEAEGWFYEGGGIYRHVYLLVVNETHIDNTFINADVDYINHSADVNIEVNLAHPAYAKYSDSDKSLSNLQFKMDIISPSNECIYTGLYNAQGETSQYKIELQNIELWDTENPNLYKLELTLLDSEISLDSTSTKFGLRHIRFDSEEGFFLNGKQTKIKGVCCHQNHGGVGSAIPDELYRYRLLKLKEMGANGYRTSHYPPSPVVLDICDELGILVMDETRLLSSEKGDLDQLKTLVIRDRNHPSVIMYSIGNEEAQSQHTKQGARIAKTQIELVKSLDPTRPVTMALLMLYMKTGERIKNPHWLDGIGNQLDVAGFNYNMDMWQPYREVHEGQPIISTEQGTFRSTRGCYITDNDACHLSMIDQEDAQYLVGIERWHGIRNPWMSGQFLWTGFDYYGEPTPYKWPAISSQFGILDLCGFPKDFYYYYKAWWNEDKPLVHICNNWNVQYRDSQAVSERNLLIFSNCPKVELIKNNESLGVKEVPEDGYVIWENVKFVPGEVIAIGLSNNTEIARDAIKTTGPAFDVRCLLDYHENSLYIYKVEVLDKDGNFVPDGTIQLDFKVNNGRILGTCNGDPSDNTVPNSTSRSTFNGLAQVIVMADQDPEITYKMEIIN